MAAVNLNAREREYSESQHISKLFFLIEHKNISVDEVKEYLEKHKPNINAYNFTKGTLLYLAVKRKDTELVKLFLEYGADPNIKSSFYDNIHYLNLPIILAIDNKNEELAKMLIDYGARVPLLGSPDIAWLQDNLTSELENYNDPENQEDVKELKEVYNRLIQYAARKNKNQRRLKNNMRNKFESKVGGPNMVKLIGEFAGMKGGKTKKRKTSKRKSRKTKK